jgi:hypothetical protein
MADDNSPDKTPEERPDPLPIRGPLTQTQTDFRTIVAENMEQANGMQVFDDFG